MIKMPFIMNNKVSRNLPTEVKVTRPIPYRLSTLLEDKLKFSRTIPPPPPPPPTEDKDIPLKIFVLCYDDNSESIATQRYGNIKWCRIVRIESSVYLENYMYSEWLENHIDEWKDLDYVGTIAYKAHTKRGLFPNIVSLYETVKRKDIDVVSFMPGERTSIPNHSERHHKGFTECWTKLLEEAGYSNTDIMNTGIPMFFCNYWFCKPVWMTKYISFFKRTKEIMDTNPQLKDLLSRNAQYRGMSTNRCLTVFGVPHYTFHPFICERLPCFFFWLNKAKYLGI
jgi:hypothetical protein